jgi:crotonobetainyl-CoA:carnitine CoA-transferase CaiB-like acyl-CoA transferase
LDGVRIIDLSTTFMGPYCTMLLARMGADVIKVEAPGGDIVRHLGSGRNPGMGPIFLSANHGKRSVGLDLKHPEGDAALLRLVADADVFVTNLRPGALGRLDLSPERLTGANPRLVYCALPGFGSQGPYADRAAYDDVIQAASGIADVQGGSGAPEYIRTLLADKTVAVFGVSAVLAALFERSRTGCGQAIEVPMFESMVSFSLLEQQGGQVFDPPLGTTGYVRTDSPYRRPYATADGYLGVLVYTDRQWLAFFELIERPDLATDPRFATITLRTKHIDELYKLVEDTLPGRTSQEWMAAFARVGIAAQPVLSSADLLDDPHLRQVGLFQPVEHPSEGPLVLPRLPMMFSGEPAAPSRPAPRFAEHSVEVLREAGLSAAEVARLVAEGAVLTESPGPPHDGGTLQA